MTEKTSERPNAGPETTFRDDPGHDDIWPRDREWWKQEAESLRVQLAATIEQRDSVRLTRLPAAEKRAAESLREYGDVTRLLGEARAKLDAIQDHAAGFHAFMLSPGRCNPDEVRARATNALDGIRKVFEGVTDREPTTVDQREEPAGETKPRGCCTACEGTGTAGMYPCEDCYASGHCHPENVPCFGGDGQPVERQADSEAQR